MFAKHPKIAKKWAKKYGVPKGLPDKKKDGTSQALAKNMRKKK